MKNYVKTIMQGIFVFALVLFCAIQMEMNVQAEYIDDEVNGVSYYDEETISVGYAADWYYGSANYVYVSLKNDGDRVMNVKSNSKNLLAQKTRERYYRTTEKDYSTGKYKTEVDYGITYIGFFAKKAGTYKVTFDVIKADGTLRCTKTITVKTYSYTAPGINPVKSVKYAGKDLYTHYPYTEKKSGKLKVTLKKGYKLVSIQIGKYDKGKLVYKKIKNNRKITLATKKVSKSTTKYTNGSSTHTYDELFPTTYIKIMYKNKKTGETGEYATSLYTMNKKQSW
ncbi:MAG: hypothetical protein IJN92_01855 [Lachnospiraceae bacterium]|nr:hypothetical protein [Lachnospiraceae bacterium]